jgi:hypothetical protein
MKICALLVPREMKLEHFGGIKAMTDEQIERAIEVIEDLIRQRDAGEAAKVIEGTAETIGLPAPDVVPAGPNKVMDAGHRGRGEKAQAGERQGAIAYGDVTSCCGDSRSRRDARRAVGGRNNRAARGKVFERYSRWKCSMEDDYEPCV